MIRPGCSGFRPVSTWKSPRMETAQPLWATCATAQLSSWGKKNNPYIQSEPLVSACACCLSGALHSCEESDCLLSDLPTGAGSCRDIPPKLTEPSSFKPLLTGQLLLSSPPCWPLLKSLHVFPGVEACPLWSQKISGQLCVCAWDSRHLQLEWGCGPWGLWARVPSTGLRGKLLGRLAV